MFLHLLSNVFFILLHSIQMAMFLKVPFIEMNDGIKIPYFGLGTSAGGYARSDKIQEAVEYAISSGYRLIDTAQSYGNENQIRKAINNKISDGIIVREDMFIITKLANDRHSQSLVVSSLRDTLEQLGLDYVDLFLIHWPVEEFMNLTIGDTDYLETWNGMEECKNLGLTKSIGLSNFNEKQIQRIIDEGNIRPSALEIEVNPNLIQKELVQYCKKNNITVIAYAPLGSIPLAKANINSPQPNIDDPILMTMSNKYNKTTVQIVLRYLVDRGIVPIPRSFNKTRIEENINIFDFVLTQEEIKIIDKFNKNYRIINVPEWKSHKYFPFE